MSEPVLKLTSRRLLARNTGLNLVGQVAPVAVAVFTIPILIHRLGDDRFGMLTIVWTFIGYFSLFDLGLGRALTQVVAAKIGEGKEDEIPVLSWTGLFLMLLLGLVGTVVLAALAPLVVGRVLKVPEGLRPEALYAAFVLAFSVPVVISTAGLRGILEAKQRFDLVNAIRVPMGIYTFVAPLLVLPFSASLVPIVWVSMAGRMIVWLVHLAMCFRVIPSLRRSIRVDRAFVRPLLRYGGWMTVSNLISPVMVYMDRFLIGGLISVAAVAYYVTPYEMVTKLWMVPGALVGVLFPAFAAVFSVDRHRAAELFELGSKATFLCLFPAVLVLVAFAHEGIAFWLKSAEFARQSAPVLQWLAAGVLVNSLGHVSFAVVQGAGRSDLTAKLHLAELPLYLAAFWLLTHRFGVAGAAMAWTARVAFDSAVLWVMAQRCLGDSQLVRREGVRAAAGLGVLALVAMPFPLGTRAALFGAALAGFLALAWFRILGPGERSLVLGRVGALRGSASSV